MRSLVIDKKARPYIKDDNDIFPIPLAQAIQNLRKEKGWTTQQLGDALGKSKRTVEGWENGRLPSLGDTCKILAIL